MYREANVLAATSVRKSLVGTFWRMHRALLCKYRALLKKYWANV